MQRALLVVDVQESFHDHPLWAANSNPDLVERVGRLVDAFRTDGDLIVWILHGEPGSGGSFDPAIGRVRPMAGLEPAAGEPVLYKSSHNAFTTTRLQQLLTTAGIGEVVVCGIRTEQCVETTARVAADLGYRVTYVIDATATNPVEHRDAPPGRPLAEVLADSSTLSTEKIIERTEYALAGRFATIRTVEELVGR